MKPRPYALIYETILHAIVVNLLIVLGAISLIFGFSLCTTNITFVLECFEWYKRFLMNLLPLRRFRIVLALKMCKITYVL